MNLHLLQMTEKQNVKHPKKYFTKETNICGYMNQEATCNFSEKTVQEGMARAIKNINGIQKQKHSVTKGFASL